MKKNILIVGCMGHIGFSLAKYFSLQKFNVVGFYNNTLDKNKLIQLKQLKVRLFKNNLSNPKKILNLIKKYKITDCIYASAISHDSIAKHRPFETLLVNSLYPDYFIKFVKKKLLKNLFILVLDQFFKIFNLTKLKLMRILYRVLNLCTLFQNELLKFK